MNKSKFSLLSMMLILFSSYAFSQERLVARGEIPILAWYSIPASETSVMFPRE